MCSENESDDDFEEVLLDKKQKLVLPYKWHSTRPVGATIYQFLIYFLKDGWRIDESEAFLWKDGMNCVVINPANSVICIGRLPEYVDASGPLGENGSIIKRKNEKPRLTFPKSLSAKQWIQLHAHILPTNKSVIFPLFCYKKCFKTLKKKCKRGHVKMGSESWKFPSAKRNRSHSLESNPHQKTPLDRKSDRRAPYNHVFILKITPEQFTFIDNLDPNVYAHTKLVHTECRRWVIKHIAPKFGLKICKKSHDTKEGEVQLTNFTINGRLKSSPPGLCVAKAAFAITVAGIDQTNLFSQEKYDLHQDQVLHDIFLAKFDYYTTMLLKDCSSGREKLYPIGKSGFGNTWCFIYDSVIRGLIDGTRKRVKATRFLNDELSKICEQAKRDKFDSEITHLLTAMFNKWWHDTDNVSEIMFVYGN